MLNPFHVLAGKIRAHALRGTGITHLIAQKLTGEGPRSPHWPTIEKRWKKSHPGCAACGKTSFTQVHHLQSFATHPELELWDCSGIAPGTGPVGGKPNFITLCEADGKHHVGVGHGGSFQHGGFNPDVEADAAELLANPDRLEQVLARAKLARVTPEVKNLSA
jgi:hypothetical protein